MHAQLRTCVLSPASALSCVSIAGSRICQVSANALSQQSASYEPDRSRLPYCIVKKKCRGNELAAHTTSTGSAGPTRFTPDTTTSTRPPEFFLQPLEKPLAERIHRLNAVVRPKAIAFLRVVDKACDFSLHDSARSEQRLCLVLVLGLYFVSKLIVASSLQDALPVAEGFGSDGGHSAAAEKYRSLIARKAGIVNKATASTDDNGKTNIVLVPAPSRTDPNDPLRWPRWKKHVAFTSVCAFTFLTNYAIGGLAPAFYILSIEFSQTMTSTSHLLLYPILVLGLFNFFWVPLANYFGKRPVFVFASLLLCLCYVWGAVATSFKSLLWSNIIAAFAGSSTEALGAAIVNVSAGALRPLTWLPGS